MASPASSPCPNEGEKESPRAKRWASLAASQALAGIERQRQRLKEELEQGHIRPSEALRREEELNAYGARARKTVEMCTPRQEHAAKTASEVELAEDEGQNIFQRTQSGWKTTYNGSSERLDDTKGVRAIGYLIAGQNCSDDVIRQATIYGFHKTLEGPRQRQ